MTLDLTNPAHIALLAALVGALMIYSLRVGLTSEPESISGVTWIIAIVVLSLILLTSLTILIFRSL